MTAWGGVDGDRAGIDALVADRYLDALLGIHDSRWTVRPEADTAAADGPGDAELEPGVRHAARVLRSALVRVHPSFRFEERLAARLAAAARDGGARPIGNTILPIRSAVTDGPSRADPWPAELAGPDPSATEAAQPDPWPAELAQPDPWLAAILAGVADAAEPAGAGGDSRLAGARRPLLLGGALTSAALSLAGVAWVAWRVARPAPIADLEGTA